MSDLELPPPYSDQPTSRGFRFTTWGLLVLLTVVSLVLATVLFVGRAFGLSFAGVMQSSLMQFFYMTPLLIVWFVGLVYAINRRNLAGRKATLAIVAFVGFLATTILTQFAWMFFLPLMMQSSSNYAWVFGLLNIGNILAQTACWVLILMALFSRDRSAERPPIPTSAAPTPRNPWE